MNKIVVLKFGGSSVADDEKLNIVAQKVIEYYKNGNEVVVVLSAQGKTTDKLIKKARHYQKNPKQKRRVDACFSRRANINSKTWNIIK